MYEFFRGIVSEIRPPFVTLDVGGIGYRFSVPQSTLTALPHQGEVTLYAHLYVREDQLALYGFSNREERSVFERLISVSGVGPQIGLQIISTFKPEELQEAILKEDFAKIARVKGIGPKLARRIVLELKGLVSELYGPETKTTGEGLPPSHEQALAALQKLGYPRKSAARAIEEATTDGSEDLKTEDLVRAALRIL